MSRARWWPNSLNSTDPMRQVPDVAARRRAVGKEPLIEDRIQVVPVIASRIQVRCRRQQHIPQKVRVVPAKLRCPIVSQHDRRLFGWINLNPRDNKFPSECSDRLPSGLPARMCRRLLHTDRSVLAESLRDSQSAPISPSRGLSGWWVSSVTGTRSMVSNSVCRRAAKPNRVRIATRGSSQRSATQLARSALSATNASGPITMFGRPRLLFRPAPALAPAVPEAGAAGHPVDLGRRRQVSQDPAGIVLRSRYRHRTPHGTTSPPGRWHSLFQDRQFGCLPA